MRIVYKGEQEIPKYLREFHPDLTKKSPVTIRVLKQTVTQALERMQNVQEPEPFYI